MNTETNAINFIPEMIPIREAAERTGLSYKCLREMCLRGEIAFYRTGKKYLINFPFLCCFLNEKGARTE